MDQITQEPPQKLVDPNRFPIRKANPTAFPKNFKTVTTAQDLKSHNKNYHNPKVSFHGLTYADYLTDFHNNAGKYVATSFSCSDSS